MSSSPVPRLRLEKMSSVGQLVRRSKESKSDEENYNRRNNDSSQSDEENYNRRNNGSSHPSNYNKYDDDDYDRRDYYGSYDDGKPLLLSNYYR